VRVIDESGEDYFIRQTTSSLLTAETAVDALLTATAEARIA